MAVIAALKREAGRLSDTQGEIGGDDAVGATADAVRSKVFAHVVSLRIRLRRSAPSGLKATRKNRVKAWHVTMLAFAGNHDITSHKRLLHPEVVAAMAKKSSCASRRITCSG
jgi:hypothetical protein